MIKRILVLVEYLPRIAPLDWLPRFFTWTPVAPLANPNNGAMLPDIIERGNYADKGKCHSTLRFVSNTFLTKMPKRSHSDYCVVNMKLHQSLERKKHQLSLEKKILMTCHRTLLEDSQVCPKDICCFFSKVGLLDSKAMNSFKLYIFMLA